MKVERVNKFQIKEYKKPILIILIALVGIFIIYGGYRFFDYNSRLIKSSSYEKKYKEILDKYKRVLPYEKLYQDKVSLNKTLTSANMDLAAVAETYKGIIGYGNSYTDFNEDDKGNIEYSSERYGVTLIFPRSWYNKLIVVERGSYYDNGKGPIAIEIFDKELFLSGGTGLIFYLYIFTSKDNWNTVGKSIGEAIGINKLYENGNRVIAYSFQPQGQVSLDETLKKNYLDMVSGVDSIVKTLKVIN